MASKIDWHKDLWVIERVVLFHDAEGCNGVGETEIEGRKKIK
jgi:hypothetical protein